MFAILSRAKQDVSKEISGLEERAKQLENLEGLENDYLSTSREAESLEKGIAQSEARINQAEESASQLKGAEGKCPVCESELDEGRRKSLLDKKNLELREAGEELEGLRKKYGDSKSEKRRLEKNLEALRRLAEEAKKLPELRARIADIGRGLEELRIEEKRKEKEACDGEILKLGEELREAENRKLRLEYVLNEWKSLEENSRSTSEQAERATRLREGILKLEGEIVPKRQLRETLESLEKAVRCEELSESIGANSSKISETDRALSVLEFDYEDLKKLRKEVNGLQGIIGAKEGELKNLPELMEEKKKRKKAAEEEVKGIEEMKEELERLKRGVDNSKILHNALKEAQIALRKEFVEAINDSMGELWFNIYPYQDYSGLRLAIEYEKSRAGDYSLQLKEHERWIDADGLASGGERSLACLTLRIAFAQVLVPNLKWLVLDEPTQNLDASGISELANALRERIPEIVEQVLLITHEEELKRAVSGNCYELDRDKSRDEVTRVTRII